jgi:chloramphenicol O-acetyltransferase
VTVHQSSKKIYLHGVDVIFPLTDINEKAFRLLVPRYGMIFEEIQQRLDQDLEEYKDDEEREREEKKHHLYQLKQQLEPVTKQMSSV